MALALGVCIAPFLMLPFGITPALVVLERIERGLGRGSREIADRRWPELRDGAGGLPDRLGSPEVTRIPLN
jgi:hypothetical protein